MHVGAKNSSTENGKSIADIADCMIGEGLKTSFTVGVRGRRIISTLTLIYCQVSEVGART